jgi:serine/threonine protein kinase
MIDPDNHSHTCDFVDDVVRRLEQSWRTAGPAEVAHFVPLEDHAHREEALLALVQVDQEYRWQAGEMKKLEVYLEEWPELQYKSTNVCSLLAAECLLRARYGSPPEASELQERFPGICHLIDLQAIKAEAIAENASEDTSDLTSMSKKPPDTSPTGPSPPLVAGQVIADTYEVMRYLAGGAMGDVYLARNRPLDQLRALKVINPSLAANDEVRRRFVEEARKLLYLVGNPTVVAVHDLIQFDQESLVLVEEYVEGPTADEQRVASSDGTLPLETCLKLGVDVGEAICAAHRRNLIHRDVKPSNVIFDTHRSRYRLTDFGLAVFVDYAQETITAGTPAYCAPEQFEGNPCFASDVYSLGAMLYHVISGRPPFQMSILQRAARQWADQPSKLQVPGSAKSGVARKLTDLIHSMLERSPDSRPCISEVLEELSNLTQPREKDVRMLGVRSGRRAVPEFASQIVTPKASQWIALAGSSEASLATWASDKDSRFIQAVAECLGELLVERGIGVTTEGCSGVEFFVSRGIVRSLGDDDRDGHFLKHFVCPEWSSKIEALSFGAVYPAEGWYNKRLENTGALVIIAGGKGTLDMCNRAASRRLPIIPISATGGVSEDIWSQIWNSAAVFEYYRGKVPDSLFRRLGPLRSSAVHSYEHDGKVPYSLLRELWDGKHTPRNVAEAAVSIVDAITSPKR